MGSLSYLPLAAGHGDVDEAAGVGNSLLGATLGRLLLLLGLNLCADSISLVRRSLPSIFLCWKISIVVSSTPTLFDPSLQECVPLVSAT